MWEDVMGISSLSREAHEPWLVKHRAEWRQLGVVAVYWGLLGSMYFVPWCRNLGFFVAACYFSFLNAVVIHNHMHQGVFKSRALNNAFRRVLSFGALYPATANIPSHNLVHHHFDDDGQPDWAAPDNTTFRWNLLNLLHFPNVAGPNTFAGVQRWAAVGGRADFKRQYIYDQVFAFGLSGVLLVFDFWTTIFFVLLPQLYGARSILRINIIQHDGCDTTTEWNHSRNFVGRAFNWIMMNNGYHTIHHNRAGLHWSVLDREHEREVKPRIDPSLDEPSMLFYLLKTYLIGLRRPKMRDVASAERQLEARLSEGGGLPPREERKVEAALAADLQGFAPIAEVRSPIQEQRA